MGKKKKKSEKATTVQKKYELTDETMVSLDVTLHRIRALRNMPYVKKGDTGGWVQSEENLSHDGDCWIFDDAQVSDKAVVSGYAKVMKNAKVYDSAAVKGFATVTDRAEVGGSSCVDEYGVVYGDALVYGASRVTNHAQIYDSARVRFAAVVAGYARVYDHAIVEGQTRVSGDAAVCGCAAVYDEACVEGMATVNGCARIGHDAIVRKSGDYAVYKNTWSSQRWFTYTQSNKKWTVGCFHGTGDELVKKAYRDGMRSGRCYETFVLAQRVIDADIDPKAFLSSFRIVPAIVGFVLGVLLSTVLYAVLRAPAG